MPEPTSLVTVLNNSNNLAKVENALPVTMKSEEFARSCVQIALIAVNKNPMLARCSPTSILQAVVEMAQYGLQADGVLGHAYLVPYKTNVEGKWIQQAQMQIGYKGLLYLARNGDPDIDNIECNIVHEMDLESAGHFRVELGDTPRIEHTPNWNKAYWPEEATTNNPIAVYSVVTYKNGGKSHHFMPIDEVYAIRDKSAKNLDKDSSPWNKHQESMIKKTCLRQHCKLLNLSKEDTRYQRAVEQDEMRDMGIIEGDQYVRGEAKRVNGSEDFDDLNTDLRQSMGKEPSQNASESPQSDDNPKGKGKTTAKKKKSAKATQDEGDERMECPECEKMLTPSAFDSADGPCIECVIKAENLFK